MRGLLLPPGGSASRSASEQALATDFFPVTYLLEEVHAQALALLRCGVSLKRGACVPQVVCTRAFLRQFPWLTIHVYGPAHFVLASQLEIGFKYGRRFFLC